jgi:hypothetical protein
VDNNKKKFDFKMWFHDRNANWTINWYDFPGFSPADTAEEAIGNLAKILEGSIPYRHLLDKGHKAILSKIELFGEGKRLFRINGIEEKMLGTPSKAAQWKITVFDDVNRELLDALVKTFPEQKQIFKGKFLEDALGL